MRLLDKAVADFFKPSSQKPKPAEKTSWTVVKDSLLVGSYQAADAPPATEAHQPCKVAIFDFVCTNVIVFQPCSPERHRVGKGVRLILASLHCRIRLSSRPHRAKSSPATRQTGSGGMQVCPRHCKGCTGKGTYARQSVSADERSSVFINPSLCATLS